MKKKKKKWKNIDDNNKINEKPKPSLQLTFQFGTERITKDVPINKKIKDVLDEISIENPVIKKLVDNIRNDILLCGGEIIEYTKTIEEINKENTILEDKSVIMVPDVKTQSLYNKKY